MNLRKHCITFILLLAISGIVLPQQTQIKNYKVFYPENNPPTAVCMLIHGLNLRPSAMQWIGDELLKQGAIVVNVELWGHGNNPVVIVDTVSLEERMASFKQVTWAQWMNDIKPATDFIDSICKDTNLPGYFFGFSLGGLVGASIGIEYDFTFEKYFLLAPAIKIKSNLKTISGMMSIFPNMVVKSRTPAAYRENRGTPMAAYKALLKGAKQFKKANPYLNNCLIVVDKKDQLVSAKKLERFAQKQNYSIEIIDKNENECTYCNVKHLIIDEESLGSYSVFLSEMIDAFFNH